MGNNINEIVDIDKELICIDNKYFEDWLTEGKKYKVYEHHSDTSIRVLTNDGYVSFLKSRFITIEEWREQKLKQLGL